MRLSEIDDSNRADHGRLSSDDKCLYLYEYTSGRDYSFSTTNNLINNLKKKPTASQAQLRYKSGAITLCADALREALNPKWLDIATIVPVPGSKAADHPDFDDRMSRVAKLIRPDLDVRNLVVQTASTAAAHEAAADLGERVSVEDLLQLYQINEPQALPPPTTIGVLDDVLTAGTHFRAMKTKLGERFPDVPITGIFIARRVFPPGDLTVDVDLAF
jgi:predicted amidophosphoribosyltransferase